MQQKFCFLFVCLSYNPLYLKQDVDGLTQRPQPEGRESLGRRAPVFPVLSTRDFV